MKQYLVVALSPASSTSAPSGVVAPPGKESEMACEVCGHLSEWHEDVRGTVSGPCRAYMCECKEDPGSVARIEARRKAVADINNRQAELARAHDAKWPNGGPVPKISETNADLARRLAKWAQEDMEAQIVDRLRREGKLRDDA